MIAVHYMIGTVAILVISHGIQEYFVFTRTLEITGSKKTIYIALPQSWHLPFWWSV